VLTYRVEVYTGYVLNAGTDANVHLMLIGERGDTGYRQLLKPLSTAMSRPFQPGQVNTTFCKHASVNMHLASAVVMRHSLFYLTEILNGNSNEIMIFDFQTSTYNLMSPSELYWQHKEM